MKNYTKLIVMVLIVALGLGGVVQLVQWNHHKKLVEKINAYENRTIAIAEQIEIELDEMDTVGIKEQKVLLEDLRVEIQKDMNKAKDIEKALFYELDYMIGYCIEALDMMMGLINNPWDMMTGVPEQRLYNIEQEMDTHGQLYKQYKDELKIETEDNLEENFIVNKF